MKTLLKKVLPDSFKAKLIYQINKRKSRKLINFDTKRFFEHSFGKNKLTFSQYEAKITKEYHSIEKGLSYENLRFGFGKDVLNNLIKLMTAYKKEGHPLDTHFYLTGLSNLKKYIRIHNKNDYNVDSLERIYNKLAVDTPDNNQGGVHFKTKEDIINESKADFYTFSNSRHSIRDYSSEPVKHEDIKKSIKLASNAPSACNRQPWKIRVVEDKDLKKKLQLNQNGNRGFGDYIDKFIIITSDVQYYDIMRERKQSEIDGGMFAMNLLYAFHYYNIASIPLSASLHMKQENNLRKIFNIKDSENFIMFIGIGKMKDEFKIAKSSRRPLQYDTF